MPASSRTLRGLGVRTWPQLARHYEGADILLGNGFSINLSNRFRYDALFETFLSGCSAAGRARFSDFRTTNFEAILRDLGTARSVNKRFSLRYHVLTQAMRSLRAGLVSAMHSRHPRVGEFRPGVFATLEQQLRPFGHVFTLNYDLCLYHVIMAARDSYQNRRRAFRYNDLFWDRVDRTHLRFTGTQTRPDYRHVYYLHGALFIFPAAAGAPKGEVKLARTGEEDLLSCIAAEIGAGRFPVFVSEGTAAEKTATIRDHPYLQFALKQLAEASNPLVIYGASLSEHDAHIIDTLNEKSRRIALAIRVGSKQRTRLKDEVRRFEALLSRHDLRFYDAATLFRV